VAITAKKFGRKPEEWRESQVTMEAASMSDDAYAAGKTFRKAMVQMKVRKKWVMTVTKVRRAGEYFVEIRLIHKADYADVESLSKVINSYFITIVGAGHLIRCTLKLVGDALRMKLW
jgi:hypothetical protein